MTIIRFCILNISLFVLPLHGGFTAWRLTQTPTEKTPEERINSAIRDIQKKLHTPKNNQLGPKSWEVAPTTDFTEGAVVRNNKLVLGKNLYDQLLSSNKKTQEAAMGALAHELAHVKHGDEQQLKQDTKVAQKGCYAGWIFGIPLAMRYARTPRTRLASAISVFTAGAALADAYVAQNMYMRELRADREAVRAGYGTQLAQYLENTPHNAAGLKLWGLFRCYPSTQKRLDEINRRLQQETR